MGYASSCGQCFEIKCRPTQVISGDGTVNVDRSTACKDENKSIIIKIVDTCPCNGNEKWCCGDKSHFDLGKKAFEKVGSQRRYFILKLTILYFWSLF
jgi:Lytic transglycolase